MEARGIEATWDNWVVTPKGLGVTTEDRREPSAFWKLLGREAETREVAGGLASIELGCGWTSSTACLRDSGYLASTGFRAGLEEEEEVVEEEVMTVVLSSVLTLAVRSETGERDLRAGLRPAVDVGSSAASRDSGMIVFLVSEEV